MRHEHMEPSARSMQGDFASLPTETAQQATLGSFFSALERSLLARILNAFGSPPVQVVLWNGVSIPGNQQNMAGRVFIRDRGALLKLALDPELYFGELYSEKRIEVEGNLLEFLDAVFRTWPVTVRGTIGRRLLAPVRRNTLSGSRDNIHHHYDIGNGFYKLWLDERMIYTCAYFPRPDMSLEEAQLAKMDHICRKLRLRPGEAVVEAGCGWGALAMHMAKHYGVKVHAYNISKEQIAYARQRARSEGLEGRVKFIQDDYRNVFGKFDAFVSVGMLEHVGTDHYEALGDVIDRSLKESGRGLIHSIGFNYPRLMDAWTERHIFPGANPPSLAQMMRIFEPFDLSVLDVENLRLHYAKTVEHWLQRYEANAGRVKEMFDEKFLRAWRLYLAGAVTTFSTGDMQLFQVIFARAGNNGVPWSRHYLYESQALRPGESNGTL